MRNGIVVRLVTSLTLHYARDTTPTPEDLVIV